MTASARPVRRALRATIATIALAAGCDHGAPRPPPPSSTRDALTTLRAELAHQLEAAPTVASGSAAERALLGELATHGRTLLRRVRTRPAPLAPESLGPFLTSLDGVGNGDVRRERASFQGHGYAIASRELPLAGGTAWLEIVDPAGSPELLAAFEVERALAARSLGAGRFQALEVDGYPAVRSASLDDPSRPPGLVTETVQVLVADRVLVAVRSTTAAEPASLVELVSRIDLQGLAKLAETAAAAAPDDAVGAPLERPDDG